MSGGGVTSTTVTLDGGGGSGGRERAGLHGRALARRRWLLVIVGSFLCAALAACSAGPRGADRGSATRSGGASPGAGTGSGAVTAGAPASLPPDLAAPPRATCTPDLSPGWLRRENARTGAARAYVDGADTRDHLYLDTVSAVCGQLVRVAVSAQPGRYRLHVVRAGWYGGAGGRVVARTGEFAASRQPNAPGTDRGHSPRWHTSATLTVGPTWEPGVYVVLLQAGRRTVSASPLVVLAPATGPRAPALFVASAMTWTAYTDFGGRSLYRNQRLTGRASAADRARTVDFARPTEASGTYGVERYTTPLVRAIERTGVDVDYAADLDVDRAPSLVTGRAELVTGAHTEYVTRRVYDAFEHARDGGTNLAFLGGNAFYWQARVQRDAVGAPVSMTVHRYAREDPVTRTNPALTTVRWRDAPVLRPEAGLLGAQYDGLGVVAPLVVLDPPAWLGWQRGAILPAGAASELDAVEPGATPPGTQVIAAGGGTVKGHVVMATITYYVAPSGAGVFDAASIFTACSTTDSCETVRVPAATGAAWLDALGRVVAAFSVPRFGATHPADPGGTRVPSYAELLTTYGPAMRGSSIGGDD
jgi:hypothetical protein